MNEHPRPLPPETVLGAGEAESRFSELLARAERGESFTVTTAGRPVARITPPETFDRAAAREAAERILARLEAAGPRVSEDEAQRNWEDLKRELEDEDDERLDRWLSSSTPR